MIVARCRLADPPGYSCGPGGIILRAHSCMGGAAASMSEFGYFHLIVMKKPTMATPKPMATFQLPTARIGKRPLLM